MGGGVGEGEGVERKGKKNSIGAMIRDVGDNTLQ